LFNQNSSIETKSKPTFDVSMDDSMLMQGRDGKQQLPCVAADLLLGKAICGGGHETLKSALLAVLHED